MNRKKIACLLIRLGMWITSIGINMIYQKKVK